MAVRRNYRINLRNYGNPPAIMVSQYDENYDLVFEVYDGVVPATGLNAYTVKLVGRQPGEDPALKYEFTGTVSGIANNILSFTIDTTMTGRAGKGTAEIVILDTTNDVKFASFNLPVYVEKAAVPDGSIDADVQRAMEIAEEVQEIVDTAAAEVKGEAEAWAVGQRDGEDVPSTDPTYENNAKYYAEQAQDIADSIGIDATLSVSGKAADAKKTGDEISSLKEDLNNNVVSTNPELNSILKELYTTTDLSAVTRIREYNNYSGINALRFYDSSNTQLFQIAFSGSSNIVSVTGGYALLGTHIAASGATKDYACSINPCVNSLESMPTLYAYASDNGLKETITGIQGDVSGLQTNVGTLQTASALQKAMIYNDEYVTLEHLFIEQQTVTPSVSVGALLLDGTVDTSVTTYSIATFTAQSIKVYKITGLSPGANYSGKRLIDLENRGYYEAVSNHYHIRYISNYSGTVRLCYRNNATPTIKEGVSYDPVKASDIPLDTFYEEVDWKTGNTIHEHYAISKDGTVIERSSNSMAYSSPVAVKAGDVIQISPSSTTYYDLVVIAKVITENTLYDPIAYRPEANKGAYVVIDEDCQVAFCSYLSDLTNRIRVLRGNIATAIAKASDRNDGEVFKEIYFKAAYNGRTAEDVTTTITTGKSIDSVTGKLVTNSGYDISSFTAEKNKAYSITYLPGSSYRQVMGVSLLDGENTVCFVKGASNTRETVYIEGFAGTVRVNYRNIEAPTIKGGEIATSAVGGGDQFATAPTGGQIIYEADTKSNSGYIVNAVVYQDGVIVAARTDGKVVRIGYDGTEETLLQVDGTGLDWRGLYMDSNENVYASPHASNGTLNVSDRGLYRLAKGANSFTKVIALYNPSSLIPTETENNDDTIWTMCEDAYGNLYAGVYSHTIHQNPAIYKSTDGGLTWTYIYNFYTAGDTPGSNARHIHSIVYSKWQDALYCIVGEVNTIFKSTNGGTAWTNLNVRLDHDKGSAMLPVENGILIGSDGAYNCAIDILYNDDYNHETVWLGWANTVFGIRRSDETGMIYAFCKIDSSAKSTSYFPPSSVLSLSGAEQTVAINEWKASVSEARAANWQSYHDSIVTRYPDDAIIPQHYAILVSRDGGRHFEPLKRWEVNDIQPYGFWTVGYFINGECLAGRYVNGYVRPIAVSEGRHKYISGGCDLSGEILVRTNTSTTVEVITQEKLQ